MRWTGLLAVCGTTKAGLEPMAVADKAKADVVRRPGLCRVTGDLSATLAGRELALPHHHSHTTFQQKLLMKSSLIGFFTSHWPPKFSWVDAKLIRVPLKLRSTANRQKKTRVYPVPSRSPKLSTIYHPCVSENDIKLRRDACFQ